MAPTRDISKYVVTKGFSDRFRPYRINFPTLYKNNLFHPQKNFLSSI